MILVDVNVLVYAFREDLSEHRAYHDWLHTTLRSEAAFGVSELVLTSFIRIVTNPRAFDDPAPVARALEAADALRLHPSAVTIHPGARHWEIFSRLCKDVKARGNLVSDAYFAALAIESGSEWITTDGDFARFPGLRWRHPLAKVD